MRLLLFLLFILMPAVASVAQTEDPRPRIKPVPPVERVQVGTLSPAYQWITRDHIRGIYGFAGDWKNQDLLTKIVNAGFNTMLVHAMGPEVMSERGWLKEVAAWAQVQKERNLRVIISWPYGSDELYANTQFGAYDTGTSKRWTRGAPCPRSREYWDKVIGDRAMAAARAGLAGLVVDPEMYSADQTAFPGPCHCDTCWKLFVSEQITNARDSTLNIPAPQRAEWIAARKGTADYARWQEAGVITILADIRKKVRAVNPDFLLGNLASIEYSIPGLARGLGTAEMPALIFGEREYKGRDVDNWFNVSGLPERVAALKTGGHPALFVSGLWPQHVIPPDMPAVARKLGAPFAGYWIWSTAAFRAGVAGDYAFHKSYSADDYWNAFRLANDGLQEQKPWPLKEPVPEIAPVPMGKLSAAYDWITRDRIRGMYTFVHEANNPELLKQIVAAGFNTVIVHAMGDSMSEAGWPKTAALWAGIQKDYPLRVIISWPYGTDDRYSNTQFGAYASGTAEVWKKAPCPVSAEYWNKVFGDRAVEAAKAGLTGMVLDMEMYGADHTNYSGPCYCDDCWQRFVDTHTSTAYLKKVEVADRAAWVSTNGLWLEYARWQEMEVTKILKAIQARVRAENPDFLLGNLYGPETVPGLARGLGSATMPALIFSELEYHGNVTGVAQRIEELRDQGYPALYVPGLWIQPVIPPQLTSLISTSAPPSAGFWIWSSQAFHPQAGGDYAHAKEFSHDDYWQAFRAANEALTKDLQSGAAPAPPASPAVPTVSVPRVKTAPVSASDWERAASFGGFVTYNTSAPAKAATNVRALWDGSKLYLKIACDEPTPEVMVAPSGGRDDGNLWKQESIEIFWMHPGGDRMAHLVVNSAGTIADALLIGPRPEAPGWNPDIQTSAEKTDSGWEVTLAIPLDQVGGTKQANQNHLRLEVGRNRPGSAETTCWAPTQGMYKAAPHLWGKLLLE